MSNDLTTQVNQLPAAADLAAKFDAMASQNQAQLGTSSRRISTRSGMLSLDDAPLPGNQIAAIVLGDVCANTFYGTGYDADNILPPVCYGFGQTEMKMGPDPSMQIDLNYFKPQNADCATCQHNRMGSSDTGRGKACRNSVRLVLQSAGYYAAARAGSNDLQLNYWESLEDFAAQDLYMLSVPATSIVEWAKYVKQVDQVFRKPVARVITRIFLTPHPKHQFHINFQTLEEMPDDAETLDFLIRRYQEAQPLLRQGYQPPDQNAQQQGVPGRLRGM